MRERLHALPSRLRTARFQAIALPVVIAAATLGFGRFVDGHYRIRDWLFWVYAQAWVLSILFTLACLSTGWVIVRRLAGRHVPSAELFTLALPAGVFAFFAAFFVLGLFGLLGPPLFVLLPAAMIAAGARPLWAHGRRWLRHRAAWRRRTAPPSPWTFVAWAFALVAIGMIYFLILTPANVSYDARWKHLAIAEHYAAQGFVGPFLEGWYPGTAPHLPSFLYAWAFLIEPIGGLFGQLSIAAHMEFVLFLSTLVGIGALVRRLVPNADPRLVWVVRFLFPGVLLYDSNLSLGTDHVAALFAIPIFLATMRAWRRLDVRACALLALLIAGALLSKYSSAVALFAFPVLAIAARSAWLGFSRRARTASGAAPGAWWKGPLTCVAGGLVFTAPHWLKNWVWYGGPLYPSGSGHFRLSPWTVDAEPIFRFGYMAQAWQPPPTWGGLWESVKVLFTFSILPHNWGFHGELPVFGSLLTLMLLCLPFVRPRRWLLALFGSIHLGIFSWFWIHHQDRHLQTLMPLMAAATAAVMILVWRRGRAARGALLAAIALQVVWAGDVWFFPTHNMAKKPIAAAADLLASGFTKKPEERLRGFTDENALRQALPKGAKVLLHDIHMHAGIGAASVSDMQGWQGGISYGRLGTPGAIFDLLRRIGITHLVWTDGASRGLDSFAGEVAFWNFAKRYAGAPKKVGKFFLAEMPKKRPEGDAPDDVAILGCGKKYRSGLYRLEDLTLPVYTPRKPEFPPPFLAATTEAEERAIVERASFVFVENDCGSIPANARRDFERVVVRKPRGPFKYAWDRRGDRWTVWMRTQPAAAPARPDAVAPSLRSAGGGAIEARPSSLPR
ncbi:MAG TPA: hypothetical protein VN033_15575 [Vulgatibacter sp.]|nr:hypothetical protein [Vulgatibacter sp.]